MVQAYNQAELYACMPPLKYKKVFMYKIILTDIGVSNLDSGGVAEESEKRLCL